MYIGIDPDLIKNGVAILHKNRELELLNLSFVDTLNLVKKNKDQIKEVRLEAGWLNQKSNWHYAENKSVAEIIGKKVGENHATGKLLQECIEAEGVKVLLVKPTTKKTDAKQFELITKYKGKTNPEKRDAGMLVVGLY